MAKKVSLVDNQVGNRLRLRRMIRGMSQESLGDKVGLTFQQIQKYEKGVNRIGAGRLFELAHVLGVSVNYFYEGMHEPLPQTAGPSCDVSGPLTEFLASPEGLQLSLAFVAIKSAKVRKGVIDLVKSIAEEEIPKH